MIRWTLIFLAAHLLAAVAIGDDDLSEVQSQMLSRNNEIREARSLKPHRSNPHLMAAAQDHASYMARTRSFSHYSNGGPSGRAARHGFAAGVRENIAYGYQTVAATFGIWTNSGGHYANLMSGTSDAGFGVAYSTDGTPYWVAVYGTPPAEPVEQEPEQPADVSPETVPYRPRFLGWLRRR